MSEENKELTTGDVRLTLAEAMDLKKKLLTSFDYHASMRLLYEHQISIHATVSYKPQIPSSRQSGLSGVYI